MSIVEFDGEQRIYSALMESKPTIILIAGQYIIAKIVLHVYESEIRSTASSINNILKKNMRY